MKKIYVSICIILAILLFGNVSNAASDFNLQSINFNATLNEDGSMQVIETWKIHVYSLTNTLFKTFTLDNRYAGITDVQVSQIDSNGQEIKFKEKNQEVLHVDKNCYYGLVNSKGKYEIAWGINENYGDKTYKISYKVEDIVKKYNDTAELYWQFIGTDFEVDIDSVTGTVILPNANVEGTNPRVWAHGPLNGNIEIVSTKKVKFDLDYFDAGNYLEVRLAMEPQLFNINTINANKLQQIISEETTYADEANSVREQIIWRKQREEKVEKMIIIGLQVMGIIVGGVLLVKCNKYINIINSTPKIKPENECEYYREIPDESATPAEAAFLYYFGKTGIENNIAKVLSATVLDLAMKKYIEIETVEARSKKERLKIKVLEKDTVQLKEDEKDIYGLLKRIQDDADGFNMKELEKYAKKHYEVFLGKLDKIPDKVKKQLEENEIFNKEIYKKGRNWLSKITTYILLIIFVMIGMFINLYIGTVIVVLSIICAVMCFIISKRYTGLTQKGENQKEAWEGLKKYMEDYSMIEDREVPELVIWEKYLVFATAFGIADKVLKQLKIQYPELSDDTFTNGTYVGAMYGNGFNLAMINSINSAVTSAYTTGVSQRAAEYDYSNMSSGGGFGGGFSGGGGGRWRWSWSEEAGGGR